MRRLIILTSAIALLICLVTFAQTESFNKKLGWNGFVPVSVSQQLSFDVRGAYTNKVRKESFRTASFLRDLCDGYPSNWIINYISSEISATCNGKSCKAVSANDELSTSQKNILNSVDIGSEIIIDVKYKHQNPATQNIDLRQMHISMMVVPEVEARYKGSIRDMRNYLQKNAIDEIEKIYSEKMMQSVLKFTVNEKGEIVNAAVTKTSGNKKVDKLLLKTINDMPDWKPAEDANGRKVKQDFEFTLGSGGC